ncbi:MAG: hypothetical protein ACFFC7_14905 [Candidatus Hermodarchaeota archaeon]
MNNNRITLDNDLLAKTCQCYGITTSKLNVIHEAATFVYEFDKNGESYMCILSSVSILFLTRISNEVM